MKADLSRDSFTYKDHFSRVLMQQGRVLTDADWNEQTSILLHHLRALAADLIGRHGGVGDSFRIDGCGENTGDFRIAFGHYYVDGVLCENTADVCCASEDLSTPPTFASQLDYPIEPGGKERLVPGAAYLVYLDVWERHISALEAPELVDPGLGGAGTTTRAQVVWQAKTVRLEEERKWESDEAAFEALVVAPSRRFRCLRAHVAKSSTRPNEVPGPDGFLGSENRLYRIEIHDAGCSQKGATFKWSRDNGSVAFGVEQLEDGVATLSRDLPYGPDRLGVGGFVEIVDDRSVLLGVPGTICEVEAVDAVASTASLACVDAKDLPNFARTGRLRPVLRRWDQRPTPQPVREGEWVDLEDGIEIQFTAGGTYRTGDHWLIPARVANRDILWPWEDGPVGSSKVLPPLGIAHHYAPLARISLDPEGMVQREADLRRIISPLAQPI